MSDASTGQVNESAAQVYEDFFVPALFAEAAALALDATAPHLGASVLDVACGTGALTRAALVKVGPTGCVVGLDRNEGMLAVAGTNAPRIEWRYGRAESLPYGEGAFDAVYCQFGLMFFEDRLAALREMRRVTTPGGFY